MKNMILLSLLVFTSSSFTTALNARPNRHRTTKVVEKYVYAPHQTDESINNYSLNISTNPFGIIYGSYGASLGVAVGNNFALRVDANYMDYLEEDYVGVEFGTTFSIYFDSVFNGYYIEPGFNFQSVSIDGNKKSVMGPVVYAGHSWMWDSGLNIATALGIGRNFLRNKSNLDDDQVEKIEKLFPAFYLRFGYAL